MPLRIPTWPSSPLRCSSRSGFSLIELIVTISVISLLAAITFAVIGSVRGKSESTQCVSNLRQIHQAASIYAGENKMAYAPLHFYYFLGTDDLLPHESGCWTCPGDERADRRNGLGGDAELSYAINALRTGYAPESFSKARDNMLTIDDPTNTAYFGDADQYWMDPYPANQNLSYRHNDRANIVFVDGHVESVAAGDVSIYERF